MTAAATATFMQDHPRTAIAARQPASRPRRLSPMALGLSVIGLQFALAGPAAARRPPPVIEKSWCGPEGRGSVNFSILLTDSNAYAEVWFDLGLKPDLSDAVKLGKQVTPERAGSSGDGERLYQYAPTGLRPNTTYYCRARILTSFGQDQSDTQSFTTKP